MFGQVFMSKENQNGNDKCALTKRLSKLYVNLKEKKKAIQPKESL